MSGRECGHATGWARDARLVAFPGKATGWGARLALRVALDVLAVLAVLAAHAVPWLSALHVRFEGCLRPAWWLRCSCCSRFWSSLMPSKMPWCRRSSTTGTAQRVGRGAAGSGGGTVALADVRDDKLTGRGFERALAACSSWSLTGTTTRGEHGAAVLPSLSGCWSGHSRTTSNHASMLSKTGGPSSAAFLTSTVPSLMTPCSLGVACLCARSSTSFQHAE